MAICFEGKGQVLSAANLNLNVGGVIHDVEFDPYQNCYIVVGDFTQIGDSIRKNIAFIDAETLTVLNTPYLKPFTNIDGEIRCVELTRTVALPVITYHLYIGGNFGVVTTGVANTRYGIAKFTRTATIPGPVNTNFTLSGWNPNLDMDPYFTGFAAEGVDDILITNDTVIFSGRFFGVNEFTTNDPRDGLAAYTLTGTLLAYPDFASSGTYVSSRYFALQKVGANLFIGGYIDGGFGSDGKLFKLNASGDLMAGFNYNPGSLKAVMNFYAIEDSLLVVVDDLGALSSQGDHMSVFRQSNGSEKLNHSLSAVLGFVGGVGDPTSLSNYKNYVYISSTDVGKSVVSFKSVPGVTTPVAGPNWNASATNSLTASLFGHVHSAGSHLFVGGANLTTLSGSPHLRFGVYCLEPHDAKFFTTSDSTVCPGQTITYTIPSVSFADGYKWEYTGTGADLDTNGSEDLGPLEFNNANSISITFLSNFTPGQLKVTPYSICYPAGTKVYSNTIITNIDSNPLPHVSAGPDTTLTCAIDTIMLYGYSDSAVVSYEWLPMVFSQNKLVDQPDEYVFKVTTALGCSNYDTVEVLLNNTLPVALPPVGTYDLTCAQPTKTFSGSSPTPNTTSEWYDPVTTTYYSNPVAVSLPGSYQYIVTDTINGCTKDTSIFVVLNTPQPNVTVVGYPGYNPAQPLDTINCYTPVLTLTASSDTANTTAIWTDADTNAVAGNTINISTNGNYYIFVTNNSNGCTNFSAVNINSDFNPPHVAVGSAGQLNCSVDSVVLSGSSLTDGSSVEWTGGTIPASPGPVTVYEAGTYYLTATRPANGCTSVDSLVILQDSSINVFAGNDVLACNQEIINLTATYQGSITGITYLWNSGSTTTTEQYTAGSDSYGVVEIFGDNGCYGVDTVFIDLPPTPVIDFVGYKPCDNGPSGQIVASPVSGLAPFQYSIDAGNNYQGSAVFGGLYIGTYPILVKDSLGCAYNFQAAIDQSSALPEAEFLFSTYNQASDTVVIIDISNPPADSVEWTLPPGLVLLGSDSLSATILLPDTGAFQIMMTAWFGNCVVDASKIIYASPYDSLNANHYNSNGIKSIELYPNPTSGSFTVTVEFYKSQRAAMAVQDMVGYTYDFHEYDESLLITQDIELETNAIDGTYVLKVVSEFDSAAITFILAR